MFGHALAFMPFGGKAFVWKAFMCSWKAVREASIPPTWAEGAERVARNVSFPLMLSLRGPYETDGAQILENRGLSCLAQQGRPLAVAQS